MSHMYCIYILYDVQYCRCLGTHSCTTQHLYSIKMTSSRIRFDRSVDPEEEDCRTARVGLNLMGPANREARFIMYRQLLRRH
jgi:hypothetical protein